MLLFWTTKHIHHIHNIKLKCNIFWCFGKGLDRKGTECRETLLSLTNLSICCFSKHDSLECSMFLTAFIFFYHTEETNLLLLAFIHDQNKCKILTLIAGLISRLIYQTELSHWPFFFLKILSLVWSYLKKRWTPFLQDLCPSVSSVWDCCRALGWTCSEFNMVVNLKQRYKNHKSRNCRSVCFTRE